MNTFTIFAVMEDKKRVSDFVTYDLNPSISKMVGIRKVGKHPMKELTVLDSESAEVGSLKVKDKDKWVDGEYDIYDVAKFTKLFEGAEKDIDGLSSASVRMLMYIIRSLKHSTDEVRIDVPICMSELGYKSKVSVYDGLFGLLKSEFIFRKSGIEGWYFINVNKIFKGYRSKLIE